MKYLIILGLAFIFGCKSSIERDTSADEIGEENKIIETPKNLSLSNIILKPDHVDDTIGYKEINSLSNLNKFFNLTEAFKKPREVVVLYLKDQNINELPDSIDKFINLKHLVLTNNNLTEIPDKFEHLSKLETLNLSENNFVELPKSVCKLSNLISLNLAWNFKLKTIPEEIRNLRKLKVLFLWGTEIKMLLPDCNINYSGDV